MRKINKTPQALQDLDDIWDYIAQDSPGNADRFIERIEKKCRTLAEHPNMGQDCDDLVPFLQFFPVGNCVIFYRAIDTGIEVVRVLHGARDIATLF